MPSESLNTTPGPRKQLYLKEYGKAKVDVCLLPLHRIVLYTLTGYIANEHIDAYNDDLLDAAKSAAPIGMIADPTGMKVLSPEFQQATQERFWPGIARLNVKRNPAIVPSSVLTKTSVRRMIMGAGQTITLAGGYEIQIAMLENLEECIEWILQK